MPLQILFVTPGLPAPFDKDDQSRTINFIKDLAKNGHKIDLVSFIEKRHEANNIEYLQHYCRSIHTLWNPKWWAFLKMLIGFFSFTPFQVLYNTSARMHFLLKRLAKKNSYDTVHIVLARLMEFSPCFKNTPIVVDQRSLLSVKTKERYSLARGIFHRGLYCWEHYKTLLYEEKIRNLHTYSLVSSTKDLKALGYNRAKVIPNNPDSPLDQKTNEKDRQLEIESAYLRAIRLNKAYQEEKAKGVIPLSIYYTENIEPLEKTKGPFLDRVVRRIFDIFSSLTGLILSFPICLAVTLLIFLQDGRPIFFSQNRVGKDRNMFKLFKFRTMITNAERKSGAVFAFKGDPRITKLGRFLRLSRLDEIPQLINVLIGNMSLIGPRPERPEFTNDFLNKIPFYDKRLNVKPGLTGWAQVRFPYASTVDDTKKKLEYDLFYVKNRSLSMTLTILLQTIVVVLTGRGAR